MNGLNKAPLPTPANQSVPRARRGGGQEIEIKLLAAPADLGRIADLALVRAMTKGEVQRGREYTTYYDAPDLSLARRGLALRVRRRGSLRIQAVKTLGLRGTADGAGVAIRREWEWPVTGDLPDFTLLRGDGLEEMIPPALTARLAGIFSTDIQRTLIPLHLGDGVEVEMALDLGQALALSRDTGAAAGGQAHRIISEVELELKRGSIADLFRLAAALHGRVPLRLSTRSKADIGFALVTGARPGPTPARPMAITPITTVTEAFRHVMRNGLAHLLDNQEALVTEDGTGDALALRELAAATRRLDAGYGLFRRLIYTDRGDALRRELRRHAKLLEKARAWQRLALALANLDPDQRRPAVGAVSQARAKALSRVRALLNAPEWTAWQLAFAQWLEEGEWTRQPHGCPFGTMMDEMAGPLLAKRIEKALLVGSLPDPRQVPSLEQAAKLARRMKYLRYALDYCRAVWPADRVRPLLDMVDALLVPLKAAAGATAGGAMLDKLGHVAAGDAMRNQGRVALAPVPALWASFTPLAARFTDRPKG
ncbi:MULTISPECIES: CYTH and CHAD domain-containing protein [unclassified Azospirillum]|uniref:CYTH and CHAD domain-containing protein n=1 Tax=unclassified Azospirillum TaxID=2630922 RepID=UPI000B75CC5C|nr:MULTISPECIES: CYTH and CHAD domain-containing protein [unclassified Azospirillum]SNS88896.1 Inorganic triphosphatase YgiF, contains CYTH and CHAD domains [Azospirillum sp. RU38E]SNT06071.1 Inorganic triphosphatase YgiF, contains CYTH and CHAD domains [Azospirillum sp. RU37A]